MVSPNLAGGPTTGWQTWTIVFVILVLILLVGLLIVR
jgi:hypothetical protein